VVDHHAAILQEELHYNGRMISSVKLCNKRRADPAVSQIFMNLANHLPVHMQLILYQFLGHSTLANVSGFVKFGGRPLLG
jgi:hypothetical protein